MKLSVGEYVRISESDVYANARIIKINNHEVTIRPITEDEKQMTLLEDHQSNSKVQRMARS